MASKYHAGFCGLIVLCIAGFSSNTAVGIPQNTNPNYIIITVCDVPSLIVFKDKNIIRTMPIAVFFSLKQYEKLSSSIAKISKEKLNHIDAGKWTIKPRGCGVAI